MKQIERLELIDRIGRELQERMTFRDIDTYLSGFGLSAPGELTYNSKWVYTKDFLATAADEIVARIADELELPHTHVILPHEVGESRFWEAGHFRLFLSHISTFKAKTTALQRMLKIYGISSFVAHADIEPTREWQHEIENALFSMDALLAILMEGFKSSDWTDQEVGVAIGRGVPVIPVMRGVTPYGFIAKYQGFDATRKTVKDVARSIFEILVASEPTRTRMWTAFVDTMLLCSRSAVAHEKLSILESIPDVPQNHLQRLREGAGDSTVFDDAGLRDRVNVLLADNDLAHIPEKTGHPLWDDDELPF